MVLEEIYHVSHAVEDVKLAAHCHERRLGALVGKPEEVEEQGIITTMFDVGEFKIELVQPTRPDSPIGRFLPKRGEGFHHVAFQVEDLKEALTKLKENGVELIDEEPRIGAGETRMAFVHPNDAHGVLTELVELPKEKD